MYWAILFICLTGLVLFAFINHNRRHSVIQDKMSKRYQIIVDNLTSYPGSKVIKMTRNHLHIRHKGPTTITNFYITESLDSVFIDWVGQFGIIFGTHEHRWTFVKDYPQESMLKEIGEFMERKSKEMFKGDFS